MSDQKVYGRRSSDNRWLEKFIIPILLTIIVGVGGSILSELKTVQKENTTKIREVERTVDRVEVQYRFIAEQLGEISKALNAHATRQ